MKSHDVPLPSLALQEWLLLAMQFATVPTDVVGFVMHGGICWRGPARSIAVRPLDDRDLLATFLDHPDGSRSPSNAIRRYRAVRSELDRFLADLDEFFAAADPPAHGYGPWAGAS